ncbi:MAG: S1 RNA-binding domain-containing protein [Bacilli bacterium]|nr:S1 RNA-binding domain-containing protein [Bacilli bacterium]
MSTCKYKVGDVIEGRVSGIQSYGAFMTFEDDYQGLIHISEISEKFVRHVTDFVKIGSIIRVKIIEIDEENSYLRLSLKRLNDRERQVVRRPPVLKTARKKIMIPQEEQDFKPLADMLPTWIKKALEKGE